MDINIWWLSMTNTLNSGKIFWGIKVSHVTVFILTSWTKTSSSVSDGWKVSWPPDHSWRPSQISIEGWAPGQPGTYSTPYYYRYWWTLLCNTSLKAPCRYLVTTSTLWKPLVTYWEINKKVEPKANLRSWTLSPKFLRCTWFFRSKYTWTEIRLGWKSATAV